METRHKILLVDDDPDLLEVYREILGQLPSNPEIRTASSGARGLAMLEDEPMSLLICDLRMPKMDGLQVLSIVRRKYPELRTVVLTSVADEQFRSRVYALGVDLFWQKPGSEDEIKLFLDCLESLLGRESAPGFRGVQSKSLVDIVQLECISQSSSVLRITNGPLHGRIWINSGELIDAETEGARGEEAFLKILSWKAGSFESLPPETTRARTIFKSYNALLLETVQAIDESRGNTEHRTNPDSPARGVAAVAQVEGVEFAVTAELKKDGKIESRGLENAEKLAEWTRASIGRFHALGEQLQAGALEQITGLGLDRQIAIAPQQERLLCVGWRSELPADTLRERMKKVLAIWAS